MSHPERCRAVYGDDELLLVLRKGGGPILADEEESEPLLVHPAVHGRFVVVERVPEIVEALRAHADETALVEALEALGLEVVDTPVSALGWAL